MGRIRFITVRIGLEPTGYTVKVAVFNDVEVVHRDEYDRLSWREASSIADAATDAYRPGLELMAGGVQQSLFE